MKRGPRSLPSVTSFSGFFLLQVNVKRPLKDESHFEMVESGRYVILLLGQGLSVVWDYRLSISVVLKHTYQVSWPSCCSLPMSHMGRHQFSMGGQWFLLWSSLLAPHTRRAK